MTATSAECAERKDLRAGKGPRSLMIGSLVVLGVAILGYLATGVVAMNRAEIEDPAGQWWHVTPFVFAGVGLLAGIVLVVSLIVLLRPRRR